MSERVLPEGWVLASINQVSIKGEQRKPDAAERFIYVDIGSIDRESKVIASPQSLFGSDAPSRARKEIRAGDVLVSLTRPNLNAVALAGKEYDGQIASTGFEVIRPAGIDSRFIFSLVRSKSFIDAISVKIQGALYPAAKSADVKAFKFPLPPLEEQKVIADKLDELLDQVNNLKARLDAIPAIFKRFRQSVLAAAVSGRLTERWRDKNGAPISDWLLLGVGDVSTVATGKTPSRKENKYWQGGEVPWLTSASTGSIYTDSAEQFVTQAAVEDCSLKVFGTGTLLLAMYGEGKTRGQVTELRLSATCNQACAAVIADNTKILRSYLKLRLLENYDQTRKSAAGGAQPNLNLNKVRAISINVPPKKEQVEIVRCVDQLFAFADQIEQQVKNAQVRVDKLIQSILAKAFRGELTAEWRAENPELISDENSAEALMERIKAEKAKQKPAGKGRGRKPRQEPLSV